MTNGKKKTREHIHAYDKYMNSLDAASELNSFIFFLFFKTCIYYLKFRTNTNKKFQFD